MLEVREMPERSPKGNDIPKTHPSGRTGSNAIAHPQGRLAEAWSELGAWYRGGVSMMTRKHWMPLVLRGVTFAQASFARVKTLRHTRILRHSGRVAGMGPER
jgi:hypothetical protein